MKHIIQMVFTFFIVMGFVGCGINNSKESAVEVTIADVVTHSIFSDQTYYGANWTDARGLALGYVRPEERNVPPDLRSQNDLFYLTNGQPFETLLILQSEQEQPLLVTAILDYQQVEFELDGELGLLHEVQLPLNGILEVPIKLEGIKSGLHDFMVVAFADIYNRSLDTMFRVTADLNVIGRRAQIIVGDDQTPARQLPIPHIGRPIPPDIQLGLNTAFVSMPTAWKAHPSERQLYVAQGVVNDPFRYQIWVSNFQGKQGADYAIILFQNYHQVLMNGELLTLVRLGGHEEFVFDVESLLSPSPGMDQFQAVYVFDPYKSLLADEVRAPFVFASIRMVVELLAKE